MPKHEVICRELRIEIASGKFGADGQLPSEAQLVERYGVSRPTVARALRDLQVEGLVRRQAGAGTFVVPRYSKDRDVPNLGLLVPERSTVEIFETICGEIGALSRVGGYGLLWGESPVPYVDRDASTQHALDVCKLFIEKGVAGVFLAPFEFEPDKESVNRKLVEMLSQAGIPVVLLDRDISSFPKRNPYDLVCMDNFSAGYLLAEHMVRLGCQKLKFVARPDSASTVEARIGGVREALVKFGIDPGLSFASYGNPTDRKFVRKLQAGFDCDGILCANDTTARELLNTLGKLGVKVPGQVRVVGFDDVRNSTLYSVPLTTIHQPCREIAEVAFRAMQERIREPGIPPRTLMLAPRLVVRESCGTYRK